MLHSFTDSKIYTMFMQLGRREYPILNLYMSHRVLVRFLDKVILKVCIKLKPNPLSECKRLLPNECWLSRLGILVSTCGHLDGFCRSARGWSAHHLHADIRLSLSCAIAYSQEKLSLNVDNLMCNVRTVLINYCYL